VCTANRQLPGKFRPKTSFLGPKSKIPGLHFGPTARLASYYLPGDLTPIAAPHQGNYATFLNYPERQLRYMDAGE
jgi:hypothetical protein